MSDALLPISKLNDFVFCPASVYFHDLDTETDSLLLQSKQQLDGTAAHEVVDSARYSDRKDVLQGISVLCQQYRLIGKIDVFNIKTGVLTERKKKIKQIYDGYIFQLYAQYFSLTEMGYSVRKLQLYSMEDNKTHEISLPSENPEMLSSFENLLQQIESFSFDDFCQLNPAKCARCIYKPLCSYACGG